METPIFDAVSAHNTMNVPFPRVDSALMTADRI
jgi:hypothetical protein